MAAVNLPAGRQGLRSLNLNIRNIFIVHACLPVGRGNQPIMDESFEEIRALGAVRFGEHSCQFSFPLTMNSMHTDIRTHLLRVRPRATSFLQEQPLCTWDSKERLLQTLGNWVSSW
jgi:hypothetical protein